MCSKQVRNHFEMSRAEPWKYDTWTPASFAGGWNLGDYQ